MNKILLLILALNCCSTSSQSISKQVIGAAGTSLSNTNNKLSYTVGETVVGIMASDNNQLGNGYHSALQIQALNISNNYLGLAIQIVPNPTTELLNVSYPEINSYSVLIEDMNGKQLFVSSMINEPTIDLSTYPQGVYIITFENVETHTKSIYKIIKK